MKIRLAKKIMRHNTPYWIFRYLCYNRILLPGAGYKVDFKDHRIIKAISLTNHWNARRYINELIKSNKKHPFKLRDVQRDAERLIKTVQRMKEEERCCGNCHWFDSEDAYGVGWCCNNDHESSCDQVCDEHEF
jgi:hypothetical protein